MIVFGFATKRTKLIKNDTNYFLTQKTRSKQLRVSSHQMNFICLNQVISTRIYNIAVSKKPLPITPLTEVNGPVLPKMPLSASTAINP